MGLVTSCWSCIPLGVLDDFLVDRDGHLALGLYGEAEVEVLFGLERDDLREVGPVLDLAVSLL
jgi:hypothetical protein